MSSIRAGREHSSDPLSPLFNRYLAELAQVRTTQQVVTDPDSQRISIPSRARLKWYDCFNQQQVDLSNKEFILPVEPDFDKLTIWLTMDQAGNTLRDYSCFDNHAKIVGNPRLVEGLSYGQFGGNIALQLDGANDYFYVPEGTKNAGRITSLASGFSVCSVIYPQDLINRDSENPRLFFKQDDNSGLYGYTAQIEDTGKIEFGVRINGGLTKKRTVDTPLGDPQSMFKDYYDTDYNPLDYNAGPPNYFAIPNWFIIWFVSTQANPPVLKIYCNGTDMTLEDSSFDSAITGAGAHDTFIGAGKDAATGHIPGIYQDYRFMKRQVTAQEVTNHWNNKISISPIAYGEVFSAGAVVFGAVAPISIFLDGTNDYLDLGNDASLWSQSLTKFSWSLWVYPTVLASGGVNRDIIRHGNSGAARFRADIDGTTSGDAKFYIRNNADSADFTARVAGIAINQWQQLIGSYDSTLGVDNVRIYRNGVIGYQKANHTEAKNLSTIFTLSEANTDFQGYMKDFRFWKNHGVNTSEALDIYNGTYAVTPDYWLPMTAGYYDPVDSISGTKVASRKNGADWSFAV